MKTSKQLILLLTLLFSLKLQIVAQTADSKKEQHQLSLEVDPATFGLNGYSIHLRIQPKNCSHLLAGIGTYALDLPSLFVDFNNNNKDKGWNVRINQGYSFFLEHHFTEVHTQWFIGAQLGIQEFNIERNENIGQEQFSNALAMSYIGYTLNLGESSFYLKPWAGIGYTTKLTGANKLNGSEYDISPFSFFLTFHAGYTF